MHIQNEAELTGIVVEYVQKTRGWSTNSFSVQLNRHEGSELAFWVLYKFDNLRTPGGGGKSFEVLLEFRDVK